VRADVSAAIIAASILGGGTSWAACPPGSPRGCVDFNAIPQISKQVIDAEKIAAPAKGLPAGEQNTPYTGPTVGVVPHSVGRAAEVGYRWAID
jgi:hypothetical protein